MAEDNVQKTVIELTLRDTATGQWVKATKEQTNELKKVGIALEQVGNRWILTEKAMQKNVLIAQKVTQAKKQTQIAHEKLRTAIVKTNQEIEKETLLDNKNKIATTQNEIALQKLAQAKQRTSFESERLAIRQKQLQEAHDNLRNRNTLLTKSITNIQYQISRLRNIILLYFFVMRPLMNVMKSVTDAASAQEKVERQLAGAMAATGKINNDQRKSLLQLASAIQTKTGISDSDVIAAEATLLQHKLNNEQIKKAIPLIVDMTAAMRLNGKENQTVAETAKIFGNALSGRLTTLRTYGIHLSDATLKTKDFNNILNDVRSSVGGMGSIYGATFEGSVEKMKQSFGDLKEAIGFVIIKSDAFKAFAELITTQLVTMTKEINNAVEESNSLELSFVKFIVFGKEVIDFFKILGMDVRFSWLGWKSLGNEISHVDKLIRALPSKLSDFKFDAKGMLTASFTGAVDLSKEKEKEFKAINQKYLNDSRELAVETRKLWDEIEGMQTSHPKDTEDFKNRLLSMIEEYAAVSEEAEKILKGIKEDAKDVTDEIDLWGDAMRSIGTGMKESISDGALRFIKRDFEDINDIAINFGDIVLKSIIEGMVQWLISTEAIKTAMAQISSFNQGGSVLGGILKLGGALLGVGGAAAGAALSTAATQSVLTATGSSIGTDILYATEGLSYFHTGGIAKRKKYHSGSNVDEVNATLLQGEGVLNRNAMRNIGVDGLNRLNRGQGGSTVNNYYIYNIDAIDTQSFRDHMSRNSDISVMANESDLRNNGSLRKTIKEVA